MSKAPWYRRNSKVAPSGKTLKERKREQTRLKGRGCVRHTGIRGNGRARHIYGK
jgi:hypothetical protein